MTLYGEKYADKIRNAKTSEERGNLYREYLREARDNEREDGEVATIARKREEETKRVEPVNKSSPKGFNLYDSINKVIGNSPEDKAFREQKKRAYQEAYRSESIKAQRGIAKRKVRQEISKPSGGFGGGFVAASINELGGVFQGAHQFNEGGFGSPEPRQRYVRRVKKGKKKRGVSRPRGEYDYMPSRDLRDFTF